MTCIVATVDHSGAVVMGADSCGSNGWSWMEVGNPKVFRLREAVQGVEMLIGCTGTFRLIDVLCHSLTVPPRKAADDPDSWIRSVFVPAVREAINNAGHLSTSNGVVSMDHGGCFLVAYGGRLWEVQSDLSVLNCPKAGGAVGSGEIAARGSLWTTREWKDQGRRVRTALEAAEAVIATVRGPFVVEELAP